ncbi:oligoendopeptidase F [Humisphaera borealis]|uniref:Oligopeptidase F n=1 Tax=Humisphaera borealis TaxID=2807512 RepID=A0A7M2WT37_9BACT|nr:oligoendopeptidase F [Humisphaera borealis]QOV88593.1 oligoendopeptidase F [Humisphaera borealis]
MAKTQSLPPRAKVKTADTWNLDSLFKSDADWEKAFGEWEKQIAGFEKFRGKLKESAEMVAACLKFDAAIDRMGERLGVYAFLKTAEDQGNSDYQRMKGRYQHVSTRAGELASFIRPELLAIPDKKMKAFLADPSLADWKLALDRVVRYRPHTLGDKEEQLLAMQGQMSDAANQIFRQLNDADLKWPAIKNEKGQKVELSHSSFSAFLHSPSRAVRKEAFHTYYAQFDAHKNTIAASLNGSVQRDVYYAKVRNHPSALEAALFPDRMPTSVYTNLIDSVHANLPAVHRYLELRRKKMKIKDIHQYDTYVPILSDLDKKYSWEQATKAVIESLEPLGTEYCKTLNDGLSAARWSDRYPNQGKQSGAFSYGTFDGLPYIMMNYQPTVLDHVFTLAHEAGHSMHSWYSARNQPFQYYNYTIFVAEVASTFNEQLLARHLMAKAKTKQEKAYLINRQIDGIRATLVRQTMFAEFEKVIHAIVEAGEPLTVDKLRSEYRKLLDLYFGEDFVIDKELELECLRIPHFYRAFYVYKYATGLSAAIALSERVTTGGAKELNDYLGFLKGGCSKDPLDLLRGAGVDMEKPDAVNSAMAVFDRLVGELDELL